MPANLFDHADLPPEPPFAAARRRAPDARAKGSAQMSANDFRSALQDHLRSSGIAGSIAAQFRRKMVEDLRGDGVLTGSTGGKRHEGHLSLKELALQSVVVDFLRNEGLLHTLSVFGPESGMKESPLSIDEAFKVLGMDVSDLEGDTDRKESNTSYPTLQPSGLRQLLDAALQQRESPCTSSSASQTERLENTQGVQSIVQKYEEALSAERKNAEKQKLDYESLLEKYQMECKETFNRELEEKMEDFRRAELNALRIQHNTELQALRIELKKEYSALLQRAIENEVQSKKSAAKQQHETELANYTARQKLLQEANDLKRREEEGNEVMEMRARKLGLEEQRVKHLLKTAEARISAAERKENELKQDLEAEYERVRAAAKQAYGKATEAVDVQKEFLSQELVLLRKQRDALDQEKSRLYNLEQEVVTLRSERTLLSSELEETKEELRHSKKRNAAKDSEHGPVTLTPEREELLGKIKALQDALDASKSSEKARFDNILETLEGRLCRYEEDTERALTAAKTASSERDFATAERKELRDLLRKSQAALQTVKVDCKKSASSRVAAACVEELKRERKLRLQQAQRLGQHFIPCDPSEEVVQPQKEINGRRGRRHLAEIQNRKPSLHSASPDYVSKKGLLDEKDLDKNVASSHSSDMQEAAQRDIDTGVSPQLPQEGPVQAVRPEEQCGSHLHHGTIDILVHGKEDTAETRPADVNANEAAVLEGRARATDMAPPSAFVKAKHLERPEHEQMSLTNKARRREENFVARSSELSKHLPVAPTKSALEADISEMPRKEAVNGLLDHSIAASAIEEIRGSSNIHASNCTFSTSPSCSSKDSDGKDINNVGRDEIRESTGSQAEEEAKPNNTGRFAPGTSQRLDNSGQQTDPPMQVIGEDGASGVENPSEKVAVDSVGHVTYSKNDTSGSSFLSVSRHSNGSGRDAGETPVSSVHSGNAIMTPGTNKSNETSEEEIMPSRSSEKKEDASSTQNYTQSSSCFESEHKFSETGTCSRMQPSYAYISEHKKTVIEEEALSHSSNEKELVHTASADYSQSSSCFESEHRSSARTFHGGDNGTRTQSSNASESEYKTSAEGTFASGEGGGNSTRKSDEPSISESAASGGSSVHSDHLTEESVDESLPSRGTAEEAERGDNDDDIEEDINSGQAREERNQGTATALMAEHQAARAKAAERMREREKQEVEDQSISTEGEPSRSSAAPSSSVRTSTSYSRDATSQFASSEELEVYEQDGDSYGHDSDFESDGSGW